MQRKKNGIQTDFYCLFNLIKRKGVLVQAGKNGQEWQKKCCDNPSGNPIIRPPENTSPNLLSQVLKIIILYQIRTCPLQLNSRIRELSLVYMDMVVCEALTYKMMLQVIKT